MFPPASVCLPSGLFAGLHDEKNDRMDSTKLGSTLLILFLYLNLL